MDIVTQPHAAMVIHTPAFAISLIEKYPEEYGITLVGVEVTRMNANDAVIPAGIATSVG